MSGDPENRSESGSEAGEHRQLANGIKNQRITKAQDRILNRMAKSTKRMPLGGGHRHDAPEGRQLFQKSGLKHPKHPIIAPAPM